MNDTPDPTERRLALLALAAKPTQTPSVCPSDEALAGFVEGRLEGEAREALLAHLNDCRACYHHWLEVATYVTSAAQADRAETRAYEAPGDHSVAQPLGEGREEGRLSGIFDRFHSLLTSWKMAVSAVTVAAAVVYVSIFWPSLLLEPDLNQQISTAYVALLAQDASEMPRIGSELPLPGEEAALGFTASRPAPPARAFGAGVWAGRAELVPSSAVSTPEVFAPPAERPWNETAWADYYAFGRWTVLLWAGASLERAAVDWHQQQAIREALSARLSDRLDSEEEARRAVAALERMEPLLAAVAEKADDVAFVNLRRALELAMQQLVTR